ncbi:hypothetical protein CEXT_46041 [Caerostris extrusa]|uniref:Uncharacterized protein n=1 Tax=Caerostris extrusa TaxID=172846 RepID=A0AAV4XDL4_CAEEX|nr:hypothetical protein CEXT_46041 [Caerostris extrusa]
MMVNSFTRFGSFRGGERLQTGRDRSPPDAGRNAGWYHVLREPMAVRLASLPLHGALFWREDSGQLEKGSPNYGPRANLQME